MGILVAKTMGIHRQLHMAIHHLRMATQLRPTGIIHHGLRTVMPLRPMRILITDRGIIPGIGTMVITAEGAITDTGGRSEPRRRHRS